jgi:hypothetical protein
MAVMIHNALNPFCTGLTVRAVSQNIGIFYWDTYLIIEPVGNPAALIEPVRRKHRQLVGQPATLRIGGRDLATSPVRATATAVTFAATLAAGSHRLAPVFRTADGHEVGAYYAVVTKLP